MQTEVVSEQPRAGGVFSLEMSVRWGDQDPMGHVNNAVYFRYLEEARIQLFQQAGIPLPSDRAGVLAHASCDFLVPIVYPASLVVRLELVRFGRTSLEVNSVIVCSKNPELVYAKGRNVMVMVDDVTGKPSPWSAADISRFAGCFVAPAAL